LEDVMSEWTRERHEKYKAVFPSAYQRGSVTEDEAAMLAEIERAWGEIERLRVPAPLTEAEAIAWGTRVAQALSHGPTVEALKQAWRREIPTWVRASRGDIPPDVRAVKDGGGQ